MMSLKKEIVGKFSNMRHNLYVGMIFLFLGFLLLLGEALEKNSVSWLVGCSILVVIMLLLFCEADYVKELEEKVVNSKIVERGEKDNDNDEDG